MTMSDSLEARTSRFVRFLARLAPAALLFAAFFGVLGLVASRTDSLAGVLAGAVAGGCLVFGLLLAYWTAVDWLNLRVIRKSRGATPALRDGDVVAIDGIVRVDGEPMTAPFSGAPCAVYTYVASYSRQSVHGPGTTRTVLAQGFHMVPTRIDGDARSLRLRAFPAFEDDLRVDGSGRQWGAQARTLIDGLAGTAAASERERESRLLEVRRSDIDQVHQDYRMGDLGPNAETLNLVEEALPVGQRVCVIGAYRQAGQAITARRSRLGPNLMVYRGSADEVLARVGKDVGVFTKAAVVLIGVGVSIVALVHAPAGIAARLPILGAYFTPPAESSPARVETQADPEAEYRALTDAGARREFAAGNAARALGLAVDADLHETVAWLIAQGVSPDTPMPERNGWQMSPLVEASRLGHAATVRALLEGGADPNVVEAPNPTTGVRRTALGEALEAGRCEIASILAAAGAIRPENAATPPCR
jgi:hypothetical protein